MLVSRKLLRSALKRRHLFTERLARQLQRLVYSCRQCLYGLRLERLHVRILGKARRRRRLRSGGAWTVAAATIHTGVQCRPCAPVMPSVATLRRGFAMGLPGWPRKRAAALVWTVRLGLPGPLLADTSRRRPLSPDSSQPDTLCCRLLR